MFIFLFKKGTELFVYLGIKAFLVLYKKGINEKSVKYAHFLKSDYQNNRFLKELLVAVLIVSHQ